MKTLIVEDDFTSRLVLQELLKDYGPSHVAVNGKEALTAIKAALDDNAPYDLICLDIMMPEMDGQQALREIRALEAAQGRSGYAGARIIMTTALIDSKNVLGAFREQCDGYLAKPIVRAELLNLIQELGLAGGGPASPDN